MSQREEHIIKGIRMHDETVLRNVYADNIPIIENFILHNQGSAEQARDVFQDAMIIIYRNIQSGDLVLNCKFGTYLYSICKKIWLQERKKQQLRAAKLKNQQALLVQEPEEDEDFLFKEQCKRLFDKHFAQISPDCQKILQMFFSDHSIEEIRAALDYKDLHHTADRKYRCKKSLMKRMMNDPLFKRLNDELP